jgi:hypothetical protein
MMSGSLKRMKGLIFMLRLMSFRGVQILCVLLLVMACAAATFGQERKERRTSGKGDGSKAVGTKKASPVAKPSPSPTPVVPVALVKPAPPEYMSGEANISVRGNQNPIIRLGLAQNGVNVIEFPAADSFFMVHPGNSELVSFDEETARLSKRSLVLRPGAAFVAPPAGSIVRGPSASISVQMQSGVVVTFLIYPVKELSQNAHRCVVMYNREEVVAARRAAGLAVNLDGKDPAIKPVSNGSIRFDSDAEKREPIVPKVSRLIAEVDSSRADERVRNGKVSKKRPDLAEVAHRALKDAVQNPARLGSFTKSRNGIGLAVASAVDLDLQARLVVVAVRNDGASDLRIVPGDPDLYVQTFDSSGKTLQIERVKRLFVESTSLEGKLSKGEVAYYAIVYEPPVLGASQRLRVSVSQTEAADEPATGAVGNRTRQ